MPSPEVVWLLPVNIVYFQHDIVIMNVDAPHKQNLRISNHPGHTTMVYHSRFKIMDLQNECVMNIFLLAFEAYKLLSNIVSYYKVVYITIKYIPFI